MNPATAPWQELDVMSKQVEHNMKPCMACHAANDSPNDRAGFLNLRYRF